MVELVYVQESYNLYIIYYNSYINKEWSPYWTAVPRFARHICIRFALRAGKGCGGTGFVQDPASERLEINVADVMLSEHDVERGQVCPQQLLKIYRRFIAPLLQLSLNGRLLHGGRKIRTAVELVKQIVNLMQ